jgi:hypothetical protein
MLSRLPSHHGHQLDNPNSAINRRPNFTATQAFKSNSPPSVSVLVS